MKNLHRICALMILCAPAVAFARELNHGMISLDVVDTTKEHYPVTQR